MKKFFISLPLILSACLLSFSPLLSNDAMAAIQDQGQEHGQSLERSHHHSSGWCRVVCHKKHGQKVCYRDCIKCRHFRCIHTRTPLLR